VVGPEIWHLMTPFRTNRLFSLSLLLRSSYHTFCAVNSVSAPFRVSTEAGKQDSNSRRQPGAKLPETSCCLSNRGFEVTINVFSVVILNVAMCILLGSLSSLPIWCISVNHITFFMFHLGAAVPRFKPGNRCFSSTLQHIAKCKYSNAQLPL